MRDQDWAAFRLGRNGHDLPRRVRADMRLRLWHDTGLSHRAKELRAAGEAAPAPHMHGDRFAAVLREIEAVERSDREFLSAASLVDLRAILQRGAS